MIDLLIFDLDGVLVDSEELASEVVAAELTAQGCEIGAAEVAARFAGYTDSALAEALSGERNLTISPDFAERVAARAIERIEAGELPLMPGVTEVLPALGGWRSCVASNSAPARIAAALAATGLAAHFPENRRFSARHVARAKPAPDLHLLAAERCAAPSDRCLVIEDSPTGVQAAVAAGMRVIGFTGASHVPAGQAARLRDLGAAVVIDDFTDLPGLLANL